jgi:hypothetical protein
MDEMKGWTQSDIDARKREGFTECNPQGAVRSIGGLIVPRGISADKPKSVKAGKEPQFQKDVEGWLRLQGYRPRTPYEITRPGPCAGWYIHLNGKHAQGNPIILDLLILSAEGWYCEIELKSETGKPTTEQEELIKRGGYLCRTLDEVKQVLLQTAYQHSDSGRGA